MNKYCQQCGICCKLIPVINGKMLRDGFQQPFEKMKLLSFDEAKNIDEDFVSNILKEYPDAKFYSCNYFTEGNFCSDEDKFQGCVNFPSHEFARMPDCCYFSGEFFIKRESVKQKIRKYKEEIIHYQALINSGDKDKSAYQKIIQSLERFISKYKSYGSDNW